AGVCGGSSGDPCAASVGDGDADCQEACDEAADSCTANDPDGSVCDDGSFCNGTETCTGGACSGSTGDPCAGPDGDGDCAGSCDEVTDSCTADDPDGTPCSEGTCQSGVCEPGEDPGKPGGCGCRVGPMSFSQRWPVALLLGLGLVFARRRRRTTQARKVGEK
ncbi:unnamed protein product, partial [marine sediment metagenome]